MPDESTINDAEQRTESTSADRTSRRGILAGLAALSGLGAITGVQVGKAGAAVARSQEAWRVEVDDETGLELHPPARIEIDDDDYTGSGNHRVGHLNEIDTDAAGATIGGGGLWNHESDSALPNRVHSHFGTIGGGAGNVTGTDDAPDEGMMATVAGGIRNEARGSAATVAGGRSNEASGPRSAVGGGINNEASGISGTVGGGIGNHADGRFGTVAGGGANSATAEYATAGGGRSNHATDDAATVAGGHKNAARGRRSTVGGGYYNRALASGAVVPGGSDNVADGEYSFATGYNARTNGHDGAFVVGDSSDEPVRADRDDAAVFQMPIHARAFNTTSTRAAKTDFESVDIQTVLERVRSLDVSRWRFDGDAAPHMGPIAEDFHAAFDLGDGDESIATVDADGVALASIQGLADRVDELEAELADKSARIDDLEERLAAIETAQSQASP